MNSYIVSTRTKKLEGQRARATLNLCKIEKNASIRAIYTFPPGKLQLSLAKSDKDKYNTRDKPGGGGVLPYKGLMGTCGQPGYVFRDFCLKQGIEFIIFCLNQGIDLSIFVSNRMSFLGR